MHRTHGLSFSYWKLYCIWKKMRQRCLNPNDSKYHLYGGRGIKVCERWNNFKNFLDDMGDVPKGKTLERKDTNGNYELNNCVWATQKEQQNNRRNNVMLTFNGETLTLPQWAQKLGLTASGLRSRLERNVPLNQMLSASKMNRKRASKGFDYNV